MKKLLTMLVCIMSVSSAAPEPNMIKLTLKDSPVRIDGFSASYDDINRVSQGVVTAVNFTNTSQKSITAIAFGFAFFGPFNNQLDVRGGLDMRNRGNLEPNANTASEWAFRFSGDFSTTTSIAFPNRIRFKDGTIWVADQEDISAQIRKLVGAGFDLSKLNQP